LKQASSSEANISVRSLGFNIAVMSHLDSVDMTIIRLPILSVSSV